MPGSVWAFYRDWQGVFAVREFDLTLLTDAQRDEYHRATAEDATYAALMEEVFHEQPEPRFPTIRLAMRYAQLEDEEETIAEEMHAYHAPGECGEIAYSSLRARRERVMQWANLAL